MNVILKLLHVLVQIDHWLKGNKMVWTWSLPVYGPNAIMIQGTNAQIIWRMQCYNHDSDAG